MSPPKSPKRDYFFGTSPDFPKIVELDLTQIKPNPDQPRKTFDEDKLHELAASITRQGLIQPIVVQKSENGNEYVLVAGERRFRAHQLLNKATIAAVITKGNPDEISLIENIQRENLNPLEEADALQRMMERYRYTQEELGQVIGKAHNTVSEVLLINTLPQTIKDEYWKIKDETVTKSALIELARVKESKLQFSIWETMKTGKFTVRQTRLAKNKAHKKATSSQRQAVASGRTFLSKVKALSNIDEASYKELLTIGNTLLEYLQRLRS